MNFLLGTIKKSSNNKEITESLEVHHSKFDSNRDLNVFLNLFPTLTCACPINMTSI